MAALGVQPDAGYGILLTGGINALYAGDEVRVYSGDFAGGIDE